MKVFFFFVLSLMVVISSLNRHDPTDQINEEKNNQLSWSDKKGVVCSSLEWLDDTVCTPLLLINEGLVVSSETNSHIEKSGVFRVYEHIAKIPGRPENYDAYVYPIPPGLPGGHHVISGFDLDEPNERQRRGLRLKHVGHGGVDLPQRKGTPIKMITLEQQQGDAEVIYVGPLMGLSVVTKHTLLEASGPRDYILIFGHLDSTPPHIRNRVWLKQDDVLGYVGDTGSKELVHLHLEARRLREQIDVFDVITKKGPGGILHESVSVVCDPRNVLPLSSVN